MKQLASLYMMYTDWKSCFPTGVDRLDRELTIGQMQGKKMQQFLVVRVNYFN